MTTIPLDLDPLVQEALVRMPSYLVGQRAIDAGPAKTESFANSIAELAKVYMRNCEIASMIYQQYGIEASAEPGDCPGSYSYLLFPLPEHIGGEAFFAYVNEDESTYFQYECYVADELGEPISHISEVTGSTHQEIAVKIMVAYYKQLASLS